jgi:mRNA-degrading endonuclease RelE of RelBE toxin-antitoxin system
VKSHLSQKFIKCYSGLPERIKRITKKNYKLWKKNPNHSSLNFKEVKDNTNIYSVRIGIGWRAIGVVEQDTIIWFWIGSHEDYNNMISNL